MNRFVRQSLNCLSTIGLVCMVSSPLYAGSSWLSTVTTEQSTSSVQLNSLASSASTLAASSTSSVAVFNLAISLEENPVGDDVYPADSGVGDDAQNKFEAKIEEFANAVFQMTNGMHKIGTVTVFRAGDQANNADVQWAENCSISQGPRAHPSGFKVAGKKIFFCTNWSGAPSLMDTPKGAGYTLAHEWGHYTYGVYDEYIAGGVTNCGAGGLFCPPIWLPRSTDTASVPSIMNNQWLAVAGSQDNLEFSTIGVEPYATAPDGDDKNAHARTFEEPAWSTLTRDSGTDPRHNFLPSRTQYTNLIAPSGNLLVNDNLSTAQSELKIVWAGEQVVELMIDVSGSMSGSPINNAKTAANLLIGQLPGGSSAVGIGVFSSSASQRFAITDIPDPDTGVRNSAQAAVSSLGASGGTDIEDGALTALAQIQGFQGGSRPSVVYLLTDGQSSVNTSSVISQFTSATVPLITFGFGSNVDTALLQNLANGTGGQYFYSPTTLAQIQQAFVAANAAFTSNTLIASSTSVAQGGSTSTRSLLLDSTLGAVSINVSYALSESDITLQLVDGAGVDTGVLFTCSASSEVSCETQVDVQTLGAGEYGVRIVNNTGFNKDISVLVAGTPSQFESFDIAVEIEDTAYPDSFSVRALVSKGAPLAGLSVSANVTKPNGVEVIIPMLDDGLNADLVQSDGVYSADIPYDQNGTYTTVVTASNATGNAVTTNDGLAVSVQEDGTGVVSSPTSVTENFTRAAVVNATVSNFQIDDHSNDPTTATSCTEIFDDNLDTLGRIDNPGDVDCFLFVPNNSAQAFVLRATSLRDNIQPKIRLYNAAGASQLLEADLSTSPNPSSGVIVEIPASMLDMTGNIITIEHENTATGSGAYAVSLGAILASDGDLLIANNNDTDVDGVLNDVDMCPATIIPESIVPNQLRRNRYALIDDAFIFSSTSRKQFTLDDTGGCTCEQILAQPGYSNNSQQVSGCTSTTMQKWNLNVRRANR